MADSVKKKVLKTLVIKEGKVVEERLIKPGQGVTVGGDAKNTFVLPDSSLPSQEYVLFESTDSGYMLCVTDKMKGKVAVGGTKGSLRKVRKSAGAKRDGDVWRIPLGDDDKGSVNIGDGAVWFKFEAPPAPPPTQVVKSLEQMDFRPRLFNDDDPVFMGWLAIWSALGFVLLLWVWNTVPREVELEELPDRFTKMVIEEEVEPKEIEDPVEDLEGESASQKKEEKAEKVKKKPETAEEKARQQEDLKKEVLSQSKLLIALIGTTGENASGVVENMWGDGDEGLGDIDGALGEVSGAITEGDPGLRTGEGVEGERADIGDLGGVEGGNAEVGGGPKVVAKPQVSAGDGTMDEDIGDRASAKSTVKRNYGQLRYCYERLLRSEANLEGRVEIGWSVYGGAVEGVYVVSNSTGSSALADCIVKKIERWSFDAEVEGDMSWPFVFRTQE